MDKNELNLEGVEIEWRDLYKEHPIRFVLAAIVLGGWIIEVANVQVVHFDIIEFLVSACMTGLGMWLVYGPINYHRVKRHKEMQVTADYILKKQDGKASENTEKIYCTYCGAKIEMDWEHCSKCGKKIK